VKVIKRTETIGVDIYLDKEEADFLANLLQAALNGTVYYEKHHRTAYSSVFYNNLLVRLQQ